jgi:hypothetical protein
MSCVRDHRLLPRLYEQPTPKRTPVLLLTAYATAGKPGERVSNTNYQEPRPARRIPTQEQIAHRYTRAGKGSKQQYIPPQHEASRHRVGHYAGFHPEDTPYLTGDMQHGSVVADDCDLEDDDAYYETRLPTSSRRYQGVPIATNRGRVNVVEHYHEQPLRAHRHQLPPPRHAYSDGDAQPQLQPHRRFHPLVWLGSFGIFLVLGWIGLTGVTSWWQGVQNDWKYGQMRHFEINAVVGHNDSATSPSHFTAENNAGDMYVIELPGGDAGKSIIYQITTVPGNAGNPPVTVSFQDINADAKPDMVVTIGEPGNAITVILLNNGQKFVSKL